VETVSGSNKEHAAFVCSHVFNQTKPILLISRADGDWQLLCGGPHDDGEEPKVVGLNHLIDLDPTLMEVADLPVDWEAERGSRGEGWRRRSLTVG
jgi:hypothetical protein